MVVGLVKGRLFDHRGHGSERLEEAALQFVFPPHLEQLGRGSVKQRPGDTGLLLLPLLLLPGCRENYFEI